MSTAILVLQHLSMIYLAFISLVALGLSLSRKNATIADKHDAAVKIIAAVAFAGECPGIEPNINQIRHYFHALGIDLQGFRQEITSKARISSEIARLRETNRENGQLALDRFGPKGVELRNVLRRV